VGAAVLEHPEDTASGAIRLFGGVTRRPKAGSPRDIARAAQRPIAVATGCLVEACPSMTRCGSSSVCRTTCQTFPESSDSWRCPLKELPICFTPVTPRCCSRLGRASGCWRGLPTHLAGVRGVVPRRRGLPSISGGAAMAGRFPLPGVWSGRRVAQRPGPLDLQGVPAADLGHRLRRHPVSASDLVRGRLVRDRAEAGCQRLGASARAGLRQLRDGLELAAQAATGDGPTRTGLVVRRGRDR
jgi:hypothetical protein